MKRYSVSLSGENKYIDGPRLKHNILTDFELNEEIKNDFLNSCISEVAASDPDFGNINMDFIEECSPDADLESAITITYEAGTWNENL